MISNQSKSFFFVAHVLVRYNAAKLQFENFKSLVPSATSTEMLKSATPRHITFVATFDEPIDFEAVKRKLSYYYGGKSKILAVHYSTRKMPTYFYSAHLLQNFTPYARHDGTLSDKQKMVAVAVALTTTNFTATYTIQESSVLVEKLDQPIRDVDVKSINQALLNMPHIAFLSSGS